jgi:hypothetical protein
MERQSWIKAMTLTWIRLVLRTRTSAVHTHQIATAIVVVAEAVLLKTNSTFAKERKAANVVLAGKSILKLTTKCIIKRRTISQEHTCHFAAFSTILDAAPIAWFWVWTVFCIRSSASSTVDGRIFHNAAAACFRSTRATKVTDVNAIDTLTQAITQITRVTATIPVINCEAKWICSSGDLI